MNNYMAKRKRPEPSKVAIMSEIESGMAMRDAQENGKTRDFKVHQSL
jgi:hypothetical protein